MEKIFDDQTFEGYESSGTTVRSVNNDGRDIFGIREDGEEISEDAETLAALMTRQHSELTALIGGLSSWVEELSAKLSAANKAIAIHEENERSLNTELESYRTEFYDKLAAPLLMQFVNLYNDMSEECEQLHEKYLSDPSDEELLTRVRGLEYYTDALLGALVNNGVELKTPEIGSRYDYREQRIINTVITLDPSKKDRIEAVKSDAFIYNGKVLRPAKVSVYMIKKYPLLGSEG